MGIPQMVQSRGQFGRYGALLIVFFSADLRRLLHFQHRPGRQIDPRHRAVGAGCRRAF
jgi:hypothetical protein